MIKNNFPSTTYKYGLFMGIGFCLYTTLMWLTKLDTSYLYIGQYLDMLIIALPIIVIFKAIKDQSNFHNVKIFDRIAIAVFVGSISFLIYDPFLYIYHNYINPNWFNAVVSLKESELLAENVSQSQIAIIIKKMKSSNLQQSKLFRLSAIIPSVLILPTIIALISLLFIKSKSKKSLNKI